MADMTSDLAISVSFHTVLTHCSRVDFSTLIYRKSPSTN